MADIRNEFAWSWSRDDIFHNCPRKLYWEYYGYWGGWSQDAPPTAALAYRLKKIRSVAMLVGDAIHRAISKHLRFGPSASGAVPLRDIRMDADNTLFYGLQESRDRDWERYGDPKRFTNLFEDYYVAGGVTEADRADAFSQIRDCVEGLAAMPIARRAFAVEKARRRIVDPPKMEDKKFDVDGITVFAAPDLVIEDERGGLHIIDWKTGAPQEASPAQLAVYGLYVADKLSVPIERVSAHLIYLSERQVRHIDDLASGVSEVRRRISTFTADVRERLTDVENNVAADIDKFPMTEKLALCRRCKFQQICERRQADPIAPSDDEAEPA